MDVPTRSHERHLDSAADQLAWHLESLHGLQVDVVMRDGTRAEVTVCTARSGGWDQLERRGGAVRLEPLGWVELTEVVCVVSHAPTTHHLN